MIIAEISMPAEVVLPRGVVVNLDGWDGFVAQFQACNEVRCMAREQLFEETIERMIAGSYAELAYVSNLYSKVDVKVSLVGFTKAFNSLK